MTENMREECLELMLTPFCPRLVADLTSWVSSSLSIDSLLLMEVSPGPRSGAISPISQQRVWWSIGVGWQVHRHLGNIASFPNHLLFLQALLSLGGFLLSVALFTLLPPSIHAAQGKFAAVKTRRKKEKDGFFNDKIRVKTHELTVY